MQISVLCRPIVALRTSPLIILGSTRFLLVAAPLDYWRLSETSRVRVSARRPKRDDKWRDCSLECDVSGIEL